MNARCCDKCGKVGNDPFCICGAPTTPISLCAPWVEDYEQDQNENEELDFEISQSQKFPSYSFREHSTIG
jgi:hypothetical protein